MKKLITLLALICGSAQAQFYSGNELWSRLNSSSDTYVPQAYAAGFIAGVADSYDGMLFCIPARTTIEQTKDVTYRYLSANPQTRQQGAAGLVILAFMNAWPCPKK